MTSYYSIFTGKDNQYYFNLKAGNHEIILKSEGYKSEQSALNGINSVQNNCTDDLNFERETAEDGSPYFVLKAKNHQTIGVSEMYNSQQAMENGIESVKQNGVTTEIKGLSKKHINIFLNKDLYKVLSDSMTGAQILELGNFSPDKYCLFLIKGNQQDEISSDQVVPLTNGMRFRAIFNNIKFG